jgi:hypothetical protein
MRYLQTFRSSAAFLIYWFNGLTFILWGLSKKFIQSKEEKRGISNPS